MYMYYYIQNKIMLSTVVCHL